MPSAVDSLIRQLEHGDIQLGEFLREMQRLSLTPDVFGAGRVSKGMGGRGGYLNSIQSARSGRGIIARINEAVRRNADLVNKQHLKQVREGAYVKIYEAGARSVNPRYLMSRADEALAQQHAMDHYLRMRTARQGAVEDTKRFLRQVWEDRKDRRIRYGHRHMVMNSFNLDVTLRKQGVKVVRYSDGKKYTMEHYSRMQTRSMAARLFNEGAIRESKRAGFEALVVSDGSGCGWTAHNDPMAANGMVVSIEEAAAFPIAHPYCVRTFSPTKKKKDLDKLRNRRVTAIGKKILKGAALVYGASAATNLAAAGTVRLAQSQLLKNIQRKLGELAFHGDPMARSMNSYLSRFQAYFTPRTVEQMQYFADQRNVHALPFTWSRPPVYPGMGPRAYTFLPNAWKELRVAGESFWHGVEDLPRKVRRAINSAWPGESTERGLGLIVHYIKRQVRNEDARDNVLSLLDHEARRRNWFQRFVVRLPGGETLAEQIDYHWSPFGQRIRVNITDFVHGFGQDLARLKLTLTDTGIIKALVLAPGRTVHGAVRMFQDGSVGGFLSVIPKRFLNGIFRAVVEVDEYGQLVGNLRLVPGGPVHLKLEFISKFDKDNLKRIYGRRLSFDPRDLAGAARELGVRQVTGELGAALRQFELHRAVVEWRIFNESVFNISANLRLPIREVRKILADLESKRLVRLVAFGARPEQARYTGTFIFALKNPREIFDSLRKVTRITTAEGQVPVRSTIFGNIRFSSLTAAQVEENPFLRALRSGSVRFLNKAHLDARGLQDITTNMRIFGWNVYDIADILKVRVEDVVDALRTGFDRVSLTMYNLGVRSLDDAIPNWDNKVEYARKMITRRDDPKTRADVLEIAAQGLRVEETNPATERVIWYLSGIKPGDSQARIQLKLLHLRDWMRTVEAQRGIVWRGEGAAAATRLAAKELGFTPPPWSPFEGLGGIISSITDGHIAAKAAEIRAQMVLASRSIRPRAIGLKEEWAQLLRVSGYSVDEVGDLADDGTLATLRGFRHIPENEPSPFRYLADDYDEVAEHWRAHAVLIDRENFRVGPWRFTVDDVAGVDPRDLVDDETMRQLLRQLEFVHRRYPANSFPRIHFTHIPSPMEYRGGVLILNRPGPDYAWADWDFATDWRKAVGRIFNEERSSGAFAYLRSVDDVNTFPLHEIAHHIQDHLSHAEKMELYRRVADAIGFDIEDLGRRQLREISKMVGKDEAVFRVPWSTLSSPWNTMRPVRDEFGTYAATNFDEFVAEALHRYWVAERPGPLSRLVGEYFDETLGANVRVPSIPTARATEVLEEVAKMERNLVWNRPVDLDVFKLGWYGKFDATKRIRAAAEELEGVASTEPYGPEEMRLAKWLVETWERRDLPTQPQMLRGLSLSDEALEELSSVGNVKRLSWSSFTDDEYEALWFTDVQMDLMRQLHPGVNRTPALLVLKDAPMLDLDTHDIEQITEFLSRGIIRIDSVRIRRSDQFGGDWIWDSDPEKVKRIKLLEEKIGFLLRSPSGNPAQVEAYRDEIERITGRFRTEILYYEITATWIGE